MICLEQLKLNFVMKKHGLVCCVENIMITGHIEWERDKWIPRLHHTRIPRQLLNVSDVEIIERTVINKSEGRIEN